MCGLDDRSITDREKQQIRDCKVRPNVHFDPWPFVQHDSSLEGCLAKRKGPPELGDAFLKFPPGTRISCVFELLSNSRENPSVDLR